MKKLFLIPLMAMLCTVMTFAVDITTREGLQSFLTASGTNSGVIAADLDLTAEGVHFVVAGTKDLTINDGVTLSLKSAYEDKEEEQPNGYDGHGFCFYVPDGANLTVKGNGTIATDRSVFYVAEGGELTIGESSKASQLKITTTEGRVKQRVVVCRGNAQVYNADVVARSGIFWNAGTSYVKIDGGTYLGKSSASDGSKVEGALANQYTYAVNAQGTIILKNATIKGVHGGICPADNGRLEVDNCSIFVSPDFADYSGAGSYHAIYGATYGISTVRNSKFYSKSGYAAYISNNDTKTTFALIYIYENCYFAGGNVTNSYPQVAKKCADCEEILFPVEIDQSSEWYTIAKTGGRIPLPNGYSYETTSEVIDGITYKVKTVAPATETQEADNSNEATIPWQQETTWDADWTEGDGDIVPETTTAVTIPEGKVVVVSNDPTYADAQGNIVAEASQVNLAGEGASLTVQDGATLNITNSVNIATGGKLVVEAGATVTVGEGGVVASSNEAIEVKTQEGKTGTFMIAPTVKENTHPMAKVELVSKAYMRGTDDYVWQRFGIPAYMTGVKRESVIYDHVAAPTSILKLDYSNQTWKSMDAEDEFIPFQCYELTTTAVTPGATYTFTCPLMGNGNAELVLQAKWNYYANSYTAPIDIPSFLSSFEANYPHMSATVYLYNPEDDWWTEINNLSYLFPGVTPTQIMPMQAFIFNRFSEGDNPEVDYEDNVWNPIVNPTPAPARARQSFNKAQIEIVAEDGTKDHIRLIEGAQFSSEYDNGAESEKYENPNSFNLFVENNDAHWGSVASDNFDGTIISMTSKEQTTFTMTISNVTGMDYVVRDMLTGSEIAMTEGATYMFNVPADSEISGRFQVVKVNKVPTDISNTTATTTNHGIYSVTGQFVGTNYHALPAGVYVVDGKKVVK